MLPISEQPLSAALVGLHRCGAQGINLVSIPGRVSRLGSTVLCLAHGQAACLVPHNSPGLPPCEANSMHGI